MSSTAVSHILILTCLGFASSNFEVQAKDVQRTLSCHSKSTELVGLKQAPLRARRIELHLLEVAFQGGSRQFVDQPPHDELGGLHWRYCGYDARSKVHLIERSEGDLFSGVLLFQETGATLHAGHTVILAPVAQEFLAIEQENGMDGELWSVHDFGGNIKWKGYAGVIEKINGTDMVMATFGRPHWNSKGELIAHFACTASKVNGNVTLLQSLGNWNWKAICQS